MIAQGRPRLLITGISGYLGRELIRQLTQAASPSYAALWGTFFSRPLTVAGVEAVRLDVTDREAVERLIAASRPDVVIHTAYSQAAGLTDAVTAQGAAHVARAAASLGARLVHLSSDVIFDGEQAPYTESDAADPVHAYGRAKAAAERSVRQLAPGAAIVRTSLISGLDPLDKGSAWILGSLRKKRPITLFTDEYRNPVSVQDLAAAVLELAASDFAGPIHVAGPQALSRHEMGVRLARRFDLDPAPIRPGLSRESGLVRPRDLRLDTSLAQRLLRTRLRPYDEILQVTGTF